MRKRYGISKEKVFFPVSPREHYFAREVLQGGKFYPWIEQNGLREQTKYDWDGKLTETHAVMSPEDYDDPTFRYLPRYGLNGNGRKIVEIQFPNLEPEPHPSH